MITWINQASGHNLVISDEIVHFKAKDFAASLYTPDDLAVQSFSASEGWLSRFKSHYGIKSYRLHREAASALLQGLDAVREVYLCINTKIFLMPMKQDFFLECFLTKL